MEEKIIVPVYYTEEDGGNKIIDEDSIREEFEYKLEEISKNINN